MLTAQRASRWKSRWDIARDGVVVTTLAGSAWGRGATLELEGRTHALRIDGWGRRYALHLDDRDGEVVARAERVGSKEWTVHHGDVTVRMRRRSIWRADQELLDATGAAVGAVRRVGLWYSAAEADLPGVPDPVDVFVLAVVLLSWDQAAAAAGGAAAT